MATIKPDLTRVWASGAPSGNIEDPDVTVAGKFAAGWEAEIPPFENFNFLQQLFTQGLAYINENGIGQWDTDTTYPVSGVVRGSDGNYYIALVEQSGNNPVGDITNWKLWYTDYVSMKSGRKNAVINGNFDIWQRGTNFPGVTDVYTADRWVADDQTGTITVSRQAFSPGQADVPNEPTYFMRLLNTVAASGVYNVLGQRIEDVRTFAGKEVVLSFWAKMGSNKSFDVQIRQNFGSGGSGTVLVKTQQVDITTSWQKFEIKTTMPSIFGKTIGVNNQIDFIFREQSFTTFQLDIAQFQLEEGPVATPFEWRSIAEELALCQRYYQRVLWQTSTCYAARGAASGAALGGNLLLPVEMRTTPTAAVISGGSSGTVVAVSTGSIVASTQVVTAIAAGTGSVYWVVAGATNAVYYLIRSESNITAELDAEI